MEDTFPKLLFRNYQQWGDSRVALRKKEYGIWREYTWKDCFEKVKAVFQGLLSLGLETGDKVSILGDNRHPEHLEESLAPGNGDDIAMILCASGNTDSPEEVPATHGFLLPSVGAALASNPVYDSDEYVSVISPGWFFEQVLGFGASLLTGQKLNFAESVETAPGDSREISPHTLVYPSSAWDQIASAVQTNIDGGTWPKRKG